MAGPRTLIAAPSRRRSTPSWKVTIVGIVTLVTGALAACNRSSSSEGVELKLWALGREGEVVQQLIPEFERRNPGIRVRVQQVPWSAAHEKLLTGYVGESTPDVSQMGNTWVPEFAALGALEPLDPLVTSARGIDRADFFPGIWATNLVADTTYGIPWYVDTRVIFYRTDLLARAGITRPPTSWDEWLTAMRAIKALGGNTKWAILLPLDEWTQPVVLAQQLGSPLLADGGRRGAFRQPEFRRAFEFYVSLYREGLAPTLANTQVANLYQDFAAGTFAMYITGPWNLGEFRTRLPANMQDKWATAPLPGPRGAADGLSFAGGASLVLYRTSKHKAEAWKLIQYLTESEQQVQFYKLTGDLPARVSAWRDPVLSEPRAATFNEQLKRVAPLPPVPEIELIVTRVASAVEAAARGRATIDAALEALDQEVDQILEKRRWMLARQARVSP